MAASRPDGQRSVPAAARAAAMDVEDLVARVQQADSARNQLAELLLPGVLAYVRTVDTTRCSADELLEAARKAVAWVSATFSGGDVASHIRLRTVASLRRALEQVESEQHLSADQPGLGSLAGVVCESTLEGHLQNPALRDEELWASVADGNRAFTQLAERFEPRIRHFSHKAARPGSLQAEEARQDCLLGLHNAALSYRRAPGRTFSALATTAMSRQVTSAWRKEDGQTEHRARLREEFRRAAQALGHELGREPRHEEVVARVGWGATKSANYHMSEAMHAAGRKRAVERDFPPEHGGADASTPLIEREEAVLLVTVRDAFDMLDPLSQQVLRLRVILRRSPLATARELNTTVDAVERIEAAALSQLTDFVLGQRQKPPAPPLGSGLHTH